MLLKSLSYTLYSYLNVSMSSAERVYKSWYGLFFFRLWRSWLQYKKYSLQECFISSNSYLCIELNAHSLIKQLLKQERDERYAFMPELQGSQPCEAMFRQARAMSSTYSVVVNFNILELKNRTNKIQLQSDIVKMYSDLITFPRFEQKEKTTSEECKLPVLSKDDIKTQIEMARYAVSEDIKKLGIDTNKMKLDLHCQVTPTNFNSFDYDDEECDDSSENESEEKCLENSNESQDAEDTTLSGITGELLMRDYPKHKINLDEDDRFAVVVDGTGKEKVVLKAGIVNLLLKDKCKLSSDRLKRVAEKDYVRQNGMLGMLLKYF